AEQQLNEQKQEEQSNVISFNNSSNNNQLISFDWYGYVSAGTGEYLDGNERKSIIQLPKSDIPQNADFAVTVNGDSMKPVFKNHEMIFVERTTDLLSGSIGIIIVDGEAFVKKIYIHKDCITLVSLNPTYEDKIVRDKQSIKVIGRVII
ncbi:S24 family peptidase, partial [Melissococcus plutonius]